MAYLIAGRTRARSQAIQLLFQAQVQDIDVFDLLAGGVYALEDGPLDPFGEELARGVAVNRISIERMLDNISRMWSYARMPMVDRCIMSVALFEMFCQDETPVSVAINEAVELAKAYAGDDSSAFVNGILGNVAKLAEAEPGISLAALANRVAEQNAPTKAAEAAAVAEALGMQQEPEEVEEDLEEYEGLAVDEEDFPEDIEEDCDPESDDSVE